MGVGTLGFLKGASSQMLSSLEARDKAELEVKKQDKLDQLREDRIQQREMKEAVTFKTEKTPTGYDRVGYNKYEKEVIRRAANAPEVDAQKQSEEDRGWILKERDMKEKDFKGDEAERAQRMRINANQDARAARSSSTAGAGGSKGSTGMSSGSAGVADLLLNDYSDDIKAAGITSDQARKIAMGAVTTLMSKGVKDPDVLYSSARAGFEDGVQVYIKGMMKQEEYRKFRKNRFAIDGSK